MIKRTIELTMLLSALAATAACTTTALKPAPSARQDGGDESTAVGRAGQVKLVVETDAWSSNPQSLERRVTPLRATIVNSSDRPIEVKYEHFSLSGFDGVTYHPLPPINIQGSVTEVSRYPVFAPRFAYHRYTVAPFYYPYYDPYFVGHAPWVYRAWDPFYYQRYYPRWSVNLPTQDMIELAIPEGVIQPNGQVSGFLYFPELDAADEGDRVTLAATLVDAKQHEQLGRISIPFVIE